MFTFDLKGIQVWVAMALLLLCWSIHPRSCYPHAEEDEEPTVAKVNQDYDEDQEVAHDQEMDLVDATGLENSDKAQPDCAGEQESCLDLPCCIKEHTCYNKRGYVYVKICVKEVFVSSDTEKDQYVFDD